MSINHRDILNDVESKVVARLQADSNVIANYIHEKIVKDVKTYKQSQLPAVGVYCHSIIPRDGLMEVIGVCSIVVAGSLDHCEDTCKQIVAEVFQHFDTGFIPGFANNADMENVEPVMAEIFPVQTPEHFNWQAGMVKFKITLIRFRN